jgi:hypothetical protein
MGLQIGWSGIVSGTVVSSNNGKIQDANKNLTQLSNMWVGLEKVGELGLGVGTMATGVVGWGAACVGGGPLLCAAASMAAPAFIVGGWYVTKASWADLHE